MKTKYQIVSNQYLVSKIEKKKNTIFIPDGVIDNNFIKVQVVSVPVKEANYNSLVSGGGCSYNAVSPGDKLLVKAQSLVDFNESENLYFLDVDAPFIIKL
jgi:hypothetical protein